MRVLIIRHAIAEESQDFDGPDEQRPLTAEGRRKIREAVRGLARLVKRIDILATSPLVRAVQTAKIIAAEFRQLAPVEVDELRSDTAPAKLLEWLRGQRVQQTIALVGHEPTLSRFAGFCVSGRAQSIVRFGKGAMCMIEFGAGVESGHGVIEWHMQAKQLRELAKP